MRLIKIFLFTIFLVGTGCTGPTASMPDEFWAYGSWRFEGDPAAYTSAVSKGVAFISMHFVRQQGEQYEITGTVTYDEASMECLYIGPAKSNCPINTCEFVKTVDAEFTGTAEVRDGELVVKPVWLGYPEYVPDELVNNICSSTLSAITSNFGVYQSIGAHGAGVIDSTWSVPIEGRSFVDDMPSDEIVEGDTVMSVNFSGMWNDFSGEGLIGFYRNEP